MQSDRAGWAAGGVGLYRWSGATWSPVASDVWLSAVDVSGDADGWAVGYGMVRWNGPDRSTDFATAQSSGPTALDLLSATNGWAMGAGDRTWHWTGTRWPEGTVPQPRKLFAAAEDDLGREAWAVGEDGDIWHWHGPPWRRASSPTSAWLSSVALVTESDAWAVGQAGTILHWDGGAWTVQPTPVEGWMNDVAMVGPGDDWIIGERVYGGGFWLRYTALADTFGAHLPALLRGPWRSP